MSREERRGRNKRPHALRRAMTEADVRQARAAGQPLTWRQVWDVYAAMSVDDVLALDAEHAESAGPQLKSTTGRRQAPPHVQAATEAYRLARAAWEGGLAEALAGANPDGRPARGERYIDEERDYRDAHPAPVFRDFLADVNASQREARAAA